MSGIPKRFARLLRGSVSKLPSSHDKRMMEPLIDYAEGRATLRDTDQKMMGNLLWYDASYSRSRTLTRKLIRRFMDSLGTTPDDERLREECQEFLENEQ